MSEERLAPLENPVFNLSRGPSTVTAPPPFDFTGVTMRFFPLKADFLALAKFCDAYLNIAADFAYFRPAMPYVMLCIVDYGRMSLEAGNLGWTSQNELLFSVPLEWYRPVDGEWVFHDLAQVAPFIFVDNESSQIGGREVFGWPKVQGWFGPGVAPWTRPPRQPRELMDLETRVFRELYADERPEPRKLLTVIEQPPFSFTTMPPELDSTLNPLINLSKAMLGWSRLMMQSFESLTTPAMRGYSPIDRETLPNLATVAMRYVNVFTENFQANTINLKQMRDASDPTRACYQALTNARMEILQFRRGGMLGDTTLATGDPCAGFSLRLHRYPSHPIIDTLGLDVAEETTHEGERIATLKPVLPFWQEVDLRYLTGENIAWRVKHPVQARWRNATREQPRDPQKTVSANDLGLYNTIGSGGLQVATGPFRFPNATIRVLPLLANRERLEAFFKPYGPSELGDGATRSLLGEVPSEIARFRPWGRYVYLIITSFDQTSSESNNMGRWADKQIQFAVPVLWYQGERLVSSGFVSPYMFSNSTIGATTDREVNGFTTVEAAIDSPANAWLADAGPVVDVQSLMRLSMSVFPALNVGQESELRTLMEVVDGHLVGWQDRRTWNEVAETWGKAAKEDAQSMHRRSLENGGSRFTHLRALALELLANRLPFNQFSFKQFRDAERPLQACYQELVKTRTVIERIHDLREIEKPLHVKISRYPTQPIVDELGLLVHSRHTSRDADVDCLAPLRPFYLKADLRVELADNICWRSGSTTWSLPPMRLGRARDDAPGPGRPYFQLDGPTAVSGDMVPAADHRPQRLRKTVQENHGTRLDREVARGALTSDLEPQMVVSATLSREWGHWGNPRWYKAQQQTPRIAQLPDFVIRRDEVGMAKDELFPENQRVSNVGDEADYWAP
ncbi:MAG: acetoacetate decarboxylase family protein [Pseudomonadales bacterium]